MAVRTPVPVRQQAARALSRASRPDPGTHALLVLQRKAGNAAVNALLAGRLRTTEEEAVGRLNAAAREIRSDDPAIDTVETGLRQAKELGVPVDLEGVKPPPGALKVTTTGFGPEAVAPKKPVPPAKQVSPKAKPRGGVKRRPARGPAPAGRGPGGPAGAAAVGAAAPALTPEQLLEPPVAPPGVRPQEDPAYTAVHAGMVATSRKARSHPSAAGKAKEAQAAALAPVGDLGAQAQAAKVDTMDAQQPGSFDKKAFIAAVKAAIEAKSPRTLKQADEYAESGKAAEVKGEVTGLVSQGTESQAKDINQATEAPPDESKATPKPVVPMGPEPVGQVPAVPAAGAAPKPAPPEQTNLQGGKIRADREMADAGVTEPQLLQSGEPDFQQAVADKKVAAQHADTAPAQFRQQEQQQLRQAKGQANAEASGAVTGMKAAKAKAIAGLVADKGKAKSKDEAKRTEVTTTIQGIYAAAEKDVKAILDGIDPKVEAEFGRGEAAARAAFERYVDAKMSAYKKDRYGGWLGGLRWAKDKLLGMPDKVNEFYAAGREIYLKRMDGVISRVADIVGGDLTRAKKRIATGRTQIAAYVKSLPADLRKVGGQAAQEIGEKFEALEGDVAAKQEAAVDQLASKYVEARKGLDERIEALQAENKGLVDKAIGAIKAVINTIRELAAMLRGVLARAAGVVGDIIKNPVGFLGNLIAGVKGGILKFKDTILEHLRKGLMSWLFGALAEGGIELPDSFDVKGIIKLLASLFGLTWARIRARIVKKVGEPAMAAIESGVEIFQKIRTEGVAGLWQMLLDKLGDIKETILEQVKDFVITKIITAGIMWLIGLLNPAAAFIKACKLIYDVVMFFVNNAARIKKFVDTVLDSVADVVRGNVGGVVEKINNALGQMVPILIGFLASAIGLGGIGQKIRKIVGTLQKPVTKAIDFLIDKGLKLAGPILRGLKKVGGFVKGKVAAGKAWVKGKAEAGKQKIRDWAAAIPQALSFRGGGESHRVWIESDGAHRIMVASQSMPADILLDHYAGLITDLGKTDPKVQTKLGTDLAEARAKQAQLKVDVDAVTTSGDLTASRTRLSNKQHNFSLALRHLFDRVHKERMRLTGAVPKYHPPGADSKATKGTVTCAASFLVDCTNGQSPYPTEPGSEPVGAIPGYKARTTERTPRSAYATEIGQDSSKVGTFVLEARAQGPHAERRAEMVTRSTGDAIPNTHAEARVLSQVDRMLNSPGGTDWKSRVRTIEIHLSHSPCPSCAGRLLELRKKLDNGHIRLAVVHWTSVFNHRSWPTTPQTISELRRRYDVLGPLPSP